MVFLRSNGNVCGYREEERRREEEEERRIEEF
jgi:hypothetical protein